MAQRYKASHPKRVGVVSEKGQVTIPKPLRDSLGIIPGTELVFEERGGELLARRLVPTDPIDRLIGIGKKTGVAVDALLAEMRGPAYDRKLDEQR